MPSARYQGKPLLRLIELYVLRAIGELTKKQGKQARKAEPGLREAYDIEGAWHEVIAAVMEFPPDMPDILADLWRRNVAAAEAQGAHADPEQFAMAVTDKNFS